MRVHTIDLEFQGVPGAIASFLVESGEGAFLIEAGPATCVDRLRDRLRHLGYGFSDLKGLFVTHIHLDHAGAAGEIASEGVPVHVHPEAVRHLVDPTRLVESARRVYGDEFERLWRGMKPIPSEQVHALRDGDTVSVAGLQVVARETPGHAYHHHAFEVEGSLLFAGDSAGARFAASEFLSVTSAPPQFHLGKTLESIDKLLECKAQKLFLTHFGEVGEKNLHLRDYREAVEVNALFVRQRLEEGMDGESLRVAYQAFQMEQAFRHGVPRDLWERFQLVNGTAMCADGIRLYWEKNASEGS